MMNRRKLLGRLFSASAALTLGVRTATERVVGEAPKIVPTLKTHKVAVINEEYLRATYQEEVVYVDVLRTLISNSRKRTDDVSSVLPRRYNTLGDAEAERNAVPPYILCDAFENGDLVHTIPSVLPEDDLWIEIPNYFEEFKHS